MPGGYGTIDTPWGAGGTSSPSGGYSSPGGGNVREGRNDLADAINVARSVPPQLSAAPVLQNQAQSAIAQENIRRGIGKYAGQFGDYDVDQPMATGFGSVFGASTGSTASSQTVQDVLNFMIDDKIKDIQEEKGGNMLSSQELNQAIDDAYETYYPGWNEYKYGEGEIPSNLMDMNIGVPLPGHKTIADLRRPSQSFDQRFYGMDPFDYSYYGGRPETTELIAGGPWSQKGLGEVLAEGPKGFGEMESMYGEELDPGRDASWLYLSEFGPQFRDQYIYS